MLAGFRFSLGECAPQADPGDDNAEDQQGDLFETEVGAAQMQGGGKHVDQYDQNTDHNENDCQCLVHFYLFCEMTRIIIHDYSKLLAFEQRQVCGKATGIYRRGGGVWGGVLWDESDD